MTANGTLFVSHCPLAVISLCHWESDPQITEDAAIEARRRHVHEHPHADLVTFASAHEASSITRYVKETAPTS